MLATSCVCGVQNDGRAHDQDRQKNNAAAGQHDPQEDQPIPHVQTGCSSTNATTSAIDSLRQPAERRQRKRARDHLEDHRQRTKQHPVEVAVHHPLVEVIERADEHLGQAEARRPR